MHAHGTARGVSVFWERMALPLVGLGALRVISVSVDGSSVQLPLPAMLCLPPRAPEFRGRVHTRELFPWRRKRATPAGVPAPPELVFRSIRASQAIVVYFSLLSGRSICCITEKQSPLGCSF